MEKIKNEEFEVIHVKPHKKKPWYADRFKVLIVNGGERYDCQCGLYDHFGVICCHILRVLMQLGICEIPKARIMKRWTRQARGILPGELKIYQEDTLTTQSMTFRHSFLYVNATEVVHKGNKDVGAWSIVAKDLRKTQKQLAAYYKAQEQAKQDVAGANQWKRSKSHFTAPNGYYTTDSDVGGDSETDLELMQGNSYGASSSSAGMSDSELLAIRAPSFRRPPGRPKCNRFKGHLDGIKKKTITKKLSVSRLGKKSTVSEISTEGQKKKKSLWGVPSARSQCDQLQEEASGPGHGATRVLDNY